MGVTQKIVKNALVEARLSAEGVGSSEAEEFLVRARRYAYE